MKLKALPPYINRAIAVIIGLFVVLSLAYSFADRLKLGPDEPAHFIYIRSLAIEHTPPPISHTKTDSEEATSSHEGHQPPLYYALMAIPYALLNALGADQDTIWRVLRLLNIVLGAVWIYLVYLLCRAFFAEYDPAADRYALACAAFTALIPTASYMAAVVNNDILIALLFTWAMIPMLAFFRTGKLTVKSATLWGVIMGLAILTKAQGLVLLMMSVIAGICACGRTGWKNYKGILRTLGISLGMAILVSAWWFVRCQIIYGTPMPHSLYQPAIKGGLIQLIFMHEAVELIWRTAGLLIGYFWLPYWLIEKHLPFIPYLKALCFPIVFWLVGLIIRIRRKGSVDWRSLCLLCIAPVITYVSWMQYALTVDWGTNLQGRLLLPSAAVIAIASILGADGWLKSVKAKKIGFAVGCAIMLIVNILVLWSTVTLRWGA
ncbi:MAG: hypothetical protein ABFD83_12800 [Armatimonadota bacterium]